MSISFLDCPHRNVQQFTEVCLDCGYNIYTTPEEYAEQLRQKVSVARREARAKQTVQEIRNLEAELRKYREIEEEENRQY